MHNYTLSIISEILVKYLCQILQEMTVPDVLLVGYAHQEALP